MTRPPLRWRVQGRYVPGRHWPSGAPVLFTNEPFEHEAQARSLYRETVQDALDCHRIGELSEAVEVQLWSHDTLVTEQTIGARLTFKPPPPEFFTNYRTGRSAGF